VFLARRTQRKIGDEAIACPRIRDRAFLLPKTSIISFVRENHNAKKDKGNLMKRRREGGIITEGGSHGVARMESLFPIGERLTSLAVENLE